MERETRGKINTHEQERPGREEETSDDEEDLARGEEEWGRPPGDKLPWNAGGTNRRH